MPIPFTAIAEYFRLYELQDYDEFASIIRRLDRTLIELESEASKGEEKKKNASSISNKKNPRKN